MCTTESETTKNYRPLENQIRCPYCGYRGKEYAHANGGTFRYLENIVCHREVVGVSVDDDGKKTVCIDGMYSTGEGYDDGSNPRLECRNCFGEFPVPHGFTPEFL